MIFIFFQHIIRNIGAQIHQRTFFGIIGVNTSCTEKQILAAGTDHRGKYHVVVVVRCCIWIIGKLQICRNVDWLLFFIITGSIRKFVKRSLGIFTGCLDIDHDDAEYRLAVSDKMISQTNHDRSNDTSK